MAKTAKGLNRLFNISELHVFDAHRVHKDSRNSPTLASDQKLAHVSQMKFIPKRIKLSLQRRFHVPDHK